MLKKLKGKPAWYQIWASTVAIAAIYSLIKLVVSDLSSIDHFIQAYALCSIVLDNILFPVTAKE